MVIREGGIFFPCKSQVEIKSLVKACKDMCALSCERAHIYSQVFGLLRAFLIPLQNLLQNGVDCEQTKNESKETIRIKNEKMFK